MSDLLKILLLAVACGVVTSLIGVAVARFGRSNDEHLRVGNASGIGFLVGASIGALIGVFETLINRL